mmetsp:Transcript_107685/g.303345  ORF Transcript_107685/g.303345 Transcript_107685/m.303345 type:complete len:515 (-) Transcript_107685:165-1709(-)
MPESSNVWRGALSEFFKPSTTVLQYLKTSSNSLEYCTMPVPSACSNSSSWQPNAGLISDKARSKSSWVTTMEVKSFGLEMSVTFTWRFKAKDVAERTRPSSSAPEKFLVCLAMAGIETVPSIRLFVFMFCVWMFRISCRPFSSGRLISTWTSRRPGRNKASSMRSMRFVMPINKMLLSESTPSILDKSWFTMLSPTPELSREEPRDLHIASISSKITIWSCELSPNCFCSFSASAKSLRMFSSLWPTYLFSTSGPLMILGSADFKNFANCLAINVLPVPGGPYKSIPRTWLIPSCRIKCCGKTRAAKARRKMSPNSLDKPPMPNSSKLKSGLKMLRLEALLLKICTLPEALDWKLISVGAEKRPDLIWGTGLPSPTSTAETAVTSNLKTYRPSCSCTMVCPTDKYMFANRSRKTVSKSSSDTSIRSTFAFRYMSTSMVQAPKVAFAGGLKGITNSSQLIAILAHSRWGLLSATAPESISRPVKGDTVNTLPLMSAYAMPDVAVGNNWPKSSCVK